MKKEDAAETINDSNHELWMIYNRTQHLISKSRQKELSKYDISIRNAAVLYTLLKLDEPVTPKMIAYELYLEFHTISEILKRMEKQGLILRKKDMGKKNLIRVEITEKGREVYEKSTKRESTNRIMSVLTEKERHKLKSILLRLREKAIEELI